MSRVQEVWGEEFLAYVYPPGESPSFPDSYMVDVHDGDGRLWLREFFGSEEAALDFAAKEVA